MQGRSYKMVDAARTWTPKKYRLNKSAKLEFISITLLVLVTPILKVAGNLRVFRTFHYTCSSDLHTYNTRFSDAGNLYINKSRLRIQLNSFSIFGAKLWNCLKPDLCKLRKQPFKNKILTHLWEPCQTNHRKPDLYSHSNNNSFQIIQVYMEVQNMNSLRIETKAKTV